MPPGNLLARFEEIRRLYPAAYEAFRLAREAALDRIFEQAVAAASREHTLREGINLQVVKAMFWASVVGLIENPALIAAEYSHAEICETVTAVLRYGMLKSGEHAPGGGSRGGGGVEDVEHDRTRLLRLAGLALVPRSAVAGSRSRSRCRSPCR